MREFRPYSKVFAHKDSRVSEEFRNVYSALNKIGMGAFRFQYIEKTPTNDDLLYFQVFNRGTGQYDTVLRLDVDGVLTNMVDGVTDYITENTHDHLRQLIHFIDEGPGNGFDSGAYKVTTGGLFPTSIVWYNENSVSKKKIIEKLITWTGVNPTTIQWKIYDSTETLLHTVTDTISYTGVVETSRTRTIA